MANAPSSSFSTDSIAHLYRWDEIEDWQLLKEHFDLMEGFAFIVVLAPDDWAIALLREQLTKLLPGCGAIERIRFDQAMGTESLADALLALPDPSADLRLIWIDADPASPEKLEQQEKAWQRALATLNRYRNTIQSRFSCTVALALPSRFLVTLRSAAPDLWSIRSGLFRIQPPGGSRAGIEQLPLDERSSLSRLESVSGDPAETLAEAEKLRGKPGREVLRALLLQRAGNQAREHLDWKTAQQCLEEAYSLQATVGGDPELQWSIATDLAKVFYDVARHDRAEHYLRQALQTAQQHFGWEDCKTATALNNLAQLLNATNHLVEAEPLMRRALAIDEQSYGAEHPRVAIGLNNLANLLQATNRLAEAEPLMRRALAIDEQSYGAEHPDVAIDLNNLAQLLMATNRLAEAEPLMRRALAIVEQSYGAEHPYVANCLNNLASLLQETNRLAEAEPLMRRALAIDEQSYGAEHPNVARDINNLAWLLKETNRPLEAEPLIRRALDIDEQSYGAEHPDVAIDLNNLAQLLKATNRLAEAEPLMRCALAIDEQSYGAEHPAVGRDLNNLAQLLLATNRLSEAEPLMRRMAAIFYRFQQATGHQHPYMKTDLENYRGLLAAMDVSDTEIDRRITEAMRTPGTLKPIFPEVERLLGAAKPVVDVLAELDRQYKAEGSAGVNLLPLSEPITPHLDQILGPLPKVEEK